MSTSNDDTISISSSQGEQSSGSSNPHPTSSTSISSSNKQSPAGSSDKENKPPRGPSSQPSDALLPQLARPLLPSFDAAHHGWDASNVPTAKCDLCHKQRCGTLQKCRVCKLSICHDCCVGDRLKNDRRHSIDAAAVNWDVPPSLRKRRFRAIESRPEPPKGVKKQRIIIKRRVPGRGRSGEPSAAGEARDGLASPRVMLDGAASTPDSEGYREEAGRLQQHRDYGHAGLVEAAPEPPRLSVAREASNPTAGRAQRQDTMPATHDARYQLETGNLEHSRLPSVRHSYGDDGHGRRYRAFSNEDPFYAAPAREQQARFPVPQTDGYSQAAQSWPVLPPIAALLSGRLPSLPPRATPEMHSRPQQRFYHEDQPVASEAWPLNEYVSSLGTGLANAARTRHASSGKPLDQCLRDELHAVWTSPAFIGEDRDAGFRYRRLLSAAYYASTCLGLPPRGNAAREWMCQEEQKLWEMGYESIKSVPLMDFLHEVGVRYLRQAQC
ncbi:uncharacterized protein TRIREDRAFT_120609 [Trichoderma reesei QM6a]|uniref:Predicted protein n=2 Tax=Hypocrea jecorina TaxID=51453 RepID=G0RDN1_HYPJQ|nr:uncharacterized protein TRIREDRAFT_120609 [Trichoderma reesei QM6a]EGR50808.1 predicted protein [Trichoderma reesei QM6a]